MKLETPDGESMLRQVEEYAALLKKQFDGDLLSEEEQQKLDDWKNDSALNQAIYQESMDEDFVVKEIREYHEFTIESAKTKEQKKAAMLNMIDQYSKKTPVWYRWLAAASILIVISTSVYYFARQERKTPSVADNSTPSAKDILPASNKAVLTLSNGTSVILDSVHSKVVAKEQNTIINQSAGGELIYDNAGSGLDNAKPPYNTITIPRGGKYQLRLPDGTAVWLNSSSTLHYPVVFNSKERVVELEGEAYFEVTHNAAQPFRVDFVSRTAKNKYGEVTVLGTRFDANSYADESKIKVTLLQGSVKVAKSGAASSVVKVIKPGQQAFFIKSSEANSGDISILDKEEPESDIAWLHGQFSFQKVSFQEMMRELSRWYDVDVSFEGPMPTKNIVGVVDRTMPLARLLVQLEIMGGVRFKVDGRKVSVYPQ